MKVLKPLLGFSLMLAFVLCIFAFLGHNTGPLFAAGTDMPRSTNDRIVTALADAAVTAPIERSTGISDTVPMHRKLPTAIGLSPFRHRVKTVCENYGHLCNTDADCCAGHCCSGFGGTTSKLCDPRSCPGQ